MKIVGRALACLFLYLIGTNPGECQAGRGDDIFVDSVRLKRTEFDVDLLTRRARSLISEVKEGSAYVIFLVSGPPDIASSEGGPHLDPASWTRKYRELESLEWQIGDFLKVGNDAVLRFRDGSRQGKVVLSGRDPRQDDVGGRVYSLEHIEFRKVVLGKRPMMISSAFYQTAEGEVTTEAVRALLIQARATLGTHVIRVTLRADRWFLRGKYFPISYWVGSHPGDPLSSLGADEGVCEWRGNGADPHCAVVADME